jgi:uncharacterized membrane protein
MASRIRHGLLAAGLLLAAALAWHAPSDASAQGKKPDLTEAKYYGVSTCNKCHAGAGGAWDTDFVRMNEFVTWRTEDRHALAYLALEGPRGRQIGKILKIDVTTDPRCLNCHATMPRPELQDESFNKHDGVSCDGCHGPAQHWLLDHAFKPKVWRQKTPAEKEDLGMYDVRHPLKRTQLCASCHIGNAAEGKVVTHAMYAAGHPPLPGFEVASFSRNMPPHWNDFKDIEFFKKADAKFRKQNYGDDADFPQTRLLLTGGIDSLRAMMELVGSRASHEGKPAARANAWPPLWLRPFARNEAEDRWPELDKKPPKSEELQSLWPEIVMAQADCYGCHHELKSKSWRQVRGYAGKPGRPQLQPWPFALASSALDDSKDLAAKHQKLIAALDEQPFGVPRDVAAAALELETYARRNDLPTVDRSTATRLLTALLAKGSGEILDYDGARQIAWATRIVHGESKKHDDRAVDEVFSQLDHELTLSAHMPFAKERLMLTKDLAKSDKEFAARAQDQTFLSALQKINDAELRESLARINQYDPLLFQSRMKELQKLLLNR